MSINLTVNDDDAVGLRVAEGGGGGGGAVWSVDGKTGNVSVLPQGGTQGQILKKASGTDYDVEWDDESGGGGSSPSPASTTPADLGTAAVGTSLDYARADHVHKKPTAADIGAGTYSKPSGGIPSSDMTSAVQSSLGKADAAIPAPSSPASGAFLVWNGSAWVAQTLATWQASSY